MLSSPQVIAIDDEPDHLAVLANGLNRRGVACFQILFTEGLDDIEPCPDVRVIFADLHLGGGALAVDHSTDFSTIGMLLEDRIKPSLPYLILLWTLYPDQAPGLHRFLDERLRDVTKPAAVVPLPKANYLDAAGSVRDEEALMRDLAASTGALPEAGALFEPQRQVSTSGDMPPKVVEHYRPTPEEITGRVRRLLEKAESPCDDPVPPGFPARDTTMEAWLDVDLPDFGQTPRQMLSSGDAGTLFLLDRFVNAVATARALSHPRVVRDIVWRRLEIRFREARSPDPLIPELRNDLAAGEPGNHFERWLDASNPMFGNVSPRQFFDAEEVDAGRVLEISSLLDSIDDGAFS